MHHAARALAIVCLAALSACATSASEPPRATEAIAAVQGAERAFAARVDEIGVVPAFQEFVGPDAIMFMPEPVVINPRLSTENWAGTVDWRPAYAVASREGDVVVTAGPSLWTTSRAAYPGYYFTVWMRQGDGSFKFVLDGSATIPASLYADGAADPTRIVAETPPLRSDWRTLENAFTPEAATDTRAALASRLDATALVLRHNTPPAYGPDAAPLLQLMPSQMNYAASGGGASAGGDLAWSYGIASWREGDDQNRATFARVWRYDGQRWVVAFDQLAPLEN